MRSALLAPVLCCLFAASPSAHAQPRPPRIAPVPPIQSSPAAPAAPIDLRGRFGAEIALRLMRSKDADERLRGIERASAVHTPEALALLVRAAAGAASPGGLEPSTPAEGIARSDPRALLAVVRGLADRVAEETARAALGAIVASAPQAFSTRVTSLPSRDPAADDAEGAARIRLAREEAAMALASSGSAAAIEALVASARSGPPAQDAALQALEAHPPSSAVLGGVALTTAPMVQMAARVGDLRSLDAVRASARASDAGLRAAAIEALGESGDGRGVEIARGALHDADARVRVAAATALLRLGAPDAGGAVEALVADDATALAGLRIARDAQGEGVAKAAAARAAVSADADLRAEAVAVLAAQTSAAAVHALVALLADPAIRGDAAAAIAHSRSAAALAAIESMAASAATRRLAARAYLVRRLTMGERSARLDATLESMAASQDAGDRAIALEALVALGERSIDEALADRDARVRRASAMGAMAHLDERTCASLASRLAAEADAATREVLAVALVRGAGSARVTTAALIERARSGRPDAPLAARALARRAGDALGAEVDAQLSSRDPVMRAHAALGLAESTARDTVGRLARAYAWEADIHVRTAITIALATRTGDEAAAPSRVRALSLAARLDPDRAIRWTASRALAGESATTRGFPDGEVAWLRLAAAPGADPSHDVTAALVRSDGLAVPIAFDDDGYALVPGVPPGPARLRLAPRLPAYKSAPNTP